MAAARVAQNRMQQQREQSMAAAVAAGGGIGGNSSEALGAGMGGSSVRLTPIDPSRSAFATAGGPSSAGLPPPGTASAAAQPQHQLPPGMVALETHTSGGAGAGAGPAEAGGPAGAGLSSTSSPQVTGERGVVQPGDVTHERVMDALLGDQGTSAPGSCALVYGHPGLEPGACSPYLDGSQGGTYSSAAATAAGAAGAALSHSFDSPAAAPGGAAGGGVSAGAPAGSLAAGRATWEGSSTGTIEISGVSTLRSSTSTSAPANRVLALGGGARSFGGRSSGSTFASAASAATNSMAALLHQGSHGAGASSGRGGVRGHASNILGAGMGPLPGPGSLPSVPASGPSSSAAMALGPGSMGMGLPHATSIAHHHPAVTVLFAVGACACALAWGACMTTIPNQLTVMLALPVLQDIKSFTTMAHQLEPSIVMVGFHDTCSILLGFHACLVHSVSFVTPTASLTMATAASFCMHLCAVPVSGKSLLLTSVLRETVHSSCAGLPQQPVHPV